MKFFWVLFVFSIISHADDLNFKHIIQLTVKDNPSLQAVKAQERSADFLVTEASRRMFPEISFVGSVRKQQVPLALTGGLPVSPSTVFLTGLSVNQPLYLGGKIWNGWRFRKLQHRRAKAQYLDALQKLLQKHLQLALDIYATEAKIKFLNSSEKTQKRFVALTLRRRSKGTALDYELEQAEADLLSYRPRIMVMEESLKNLKASLASGLNKPISAINKILLPKINESDFQMSMADALQKARSQRSDLKLSHMDEEAAALNRKIDMGDHKPSLSLSGFWGYQAKESARLGQGDNEMYEATLSLSVPLFSGLSSVYQNRSGNEQIYSAQKNKQQKLNEIRTQVRKVIGELQLAKVQLAKSQEWKKRTQKALYLGEKNYRVSRVSSQQVVLLQSGSERASLNYVDAQVFYYQSVIAWHMALGNPLAEQFK